ncbi:hypothetical protein [Neotabrizicola shimadae]|uniref:Uncharacterized protein n=1 Tax=Neotabrizicola shimadae TaxID=2807096 RepID=A0A8G1EEQ3_9RHOB|nr:hypothetical protein [Neotabrizicola shimadae]QYZ71593.1 hypothetical protein JO391_08910 [Neotabrizicola shimadae]
MARHGFRLFKWTVYGLLALNVWLFLRTEETLTAFIDSAAWVALLAVMEWESTSLEKPYDSRFEKRIIGLVSVTAYGIIIYAWYGYFREEDWVDFINASAWLMVCALLSWQIWMPGEYEGREHAVIKAAKFATYLVIVACALWWTIDAENPLDAIDAWLWLVCFAVIELNVFGFEARQAGEQQDAAELAAQE